MHIAQCFRNFMCLLNGIECSTSVVVSCAFESHDRIFQNYKNWRSATSVPNWVLILMKREPGIKKISPNSTWFPLRASGHVFGMKTFIIQYFFLPLISLPVVEVVLKQSSSVFRPFLAVAAVVVVVVDSHRLYEILHFSYGMVSFVLEASTLLRWTTLRCCCRCQRERVERCGSVYASLNRRTDEELLFPFH